MIVKLERKWFALAKRRMMDGSLSKEFRAANEEAVA
jgi:hypothetical protein